MNIPNIPISQIVKWITDWMVKDEPLPIPPVSNVPELQLIRSEFRADGVFGALHRDGKQICVTLEHAFDSGLGTGTFVPKVPAGTYTCKRRLSPHFGFDVFELQNVPNATYVEIHPGNFNKDSEACILVGQNITTSNGTEMITNSKYTFNELMASMVGIDEFQLVVS